MVVNLESNTTEDCDQYELQRSSHRQELEKHPGKGPNLLLDPYKILLRFRNRKYAISTDVTKATMASALERLKCT